MSKQMRDFEKLLKAHGMKLAPSKGGHIAVLKGGKRISTVSHSASDVNCFRQAIRVLVRDGHLPNNARRMKI